MRINIRTLSHIQIKRDGDQFLVQMVSVNGRKMGRPDTAQSEDEANDIARGWAEQVRKHSRYIIAVTMS